MTNSNNPSWASEGTTSLLRRGSMDKPKQSFNYPDAFNGTAQVNQLRVASQPTPISTLKRPTLQNTVPTVPKPVNGIRITRAPIPGTNNLKVNVHFSRDPADTAYESSNIYLRQANGGHSLVSSTAGTTASFVVAKTGASSTITVQSQGAGSAIPVANSPAKAFNLL
jgi:hypothetical protein